ncbi:hypothetical protein CHS0354_004416 [Potamilus streckersoni]|uniref:Uncharacterized protein n=1 Tax=Potamilus streckersoni TaxID=2493646 RepID=A0AAE0W5Q1_9BIVA|nr:hypothetical protein CHS0354_004416 [Potamilus streckersoni]
MQLCHEAVIRQSAFCHHLQRTTLPETSYMFLLEKSMMDMVVSELSEGCVYGVVFRQGRMHYLHFFESGIFSGFFESRDPAYHWSHRIKYSYDNASIVVGQNSSILTRIRLENPAGKFEQEYHPVSN